MIYKYHCNECALDYDILQGAHDTHEYQCPQCQNMCRRVFTMPSIKKNEGFYSHQLGQWVNSQTEFEEEIAKTNYLTNMNKFVGEHKKPRDEWVEQKETALADSIKTADEEWADGQEE